MAELSAFLEHISISDVSKVSSELKTLGLTSVSDLASLDGADKDEVVSSLKEAGVNIGDRGRLKRLVATQVESFKSSQSAAPPAKTIDVSIPDSYHAAEFEFVEKQILGLVQDKTKVKSAWKDLDANGNGIVSVAEVTKWIKAYYPLLDDSKAILRAHKKATKVDGDGDDWIQRDEFEILIVNIFYFCKLGRIFDQLDTDGDHRVDFEEFVGGLKLLNFGIDRESAWKEFCKMDDDRGGKVLFVEFCVYVAAKQWPGGFDDYYQRNESIGASARKKHPGNKIHGRVAGNKGIDDHADIHTTKYDQLEQQVLSQVASKSKAKKMFREMDRDRSGKISQKEFKKWAQQHHKELANPTAIKFAFRKTNEEDGDKYVQPNELQEFFYNLFYFIKLTFVFTKIDKNHDGKVSFAEFTKSLVWVGLTLDTESARKEFDSIDNGGGGNGELDFEEFVGWICSKKIPVD